MGKLGETLNSTQMTENDVGSSEQTEIALKRVSADAVAQCRSPKKYAAATKSDNKPSTRTHSAAADRLASSCLLVSRRQQGNAMLSYIREIPWQYEDSLKPDFEFSQSNCAVFLSLRYHNLNPEYIHRRISQLRNMYSLRVLLVHADANTSHALRELAKICLFSDFTMIVCSSLQEIALYVEAYKVLENKPPDMLLTPSLISTAVPGGNAAAARQQRNRELLECRAAEFLTGIRSINATDSKVLLKTFGTVKAILCASENDLTVCPGIGPQKVANICRARDMSFKLASKVESHSSQEACHSEKGNDERAPSG